MKKSVKCLISFLLVFVTMISLCSCGNPKYNDMKRYVESCSNIDIVGIDEWIYNEETKSVTLNIRIKAGSEPTLKDLNDLRIALNEYMQRNGGLLEQGWQVSVLVDEATHGSEKPYRFAVISNFENGYNLGNGDYRFETSNDLNSFQFCMNNEDVSYISSLTDVEYILIGGQYSMADVEMLNETIEEVRSLDDLKAISVYPSWYEAFTNADLDCEVIEINNGSFGDL